jgi:tetratricopeptide (TPR) repeat protein
MRIKRTTYHLFLVLLLAAAVMIQACQSDARNSTRIPPVIKKPKSQWEKDALLSLSELISRGIDLDANYFKRARIYFNQGNYTRALEDINGAIEENENTSEFFLLRGKVYREIGELDKGLDDAERAEALQQGSPELYVLLADLLQAKGKFREAVRYLNHAMKLSPYDGSAYYVKGMLQARQGDSLASLASLNYAMNNNPRLLRAYLQSTIINRKLQNYAQALSINNRAIKRFPNMAELYYEQGEIYNTLSQPDTALFFYKKATAINPAYTKALFQTASIEIKQMHYQNAALTLLKLKKANPNYPGINNMIGYCYEKAGDHDTARGYYGTVLALDPTDRNARNGMWRMRTKESTALSYGSEEEEEGYKLLDTSRVKINMIQPRKTINMNVDSSRKAKIQ